MDEQMLCANAGLRFSADDVRCSAVTYARRHGGNGCYLRLPSAIVLHFVFRPDGSNGVLQKKSL